MKWLSVRQPWAALIACGIKDVENRSKPTKHRGAVMIHASKAYDNAAHMAILAGDFLPKLSKGEKLEIIRLKLRHPLQKGGYALAVVDIVDCVQNHPSPWAQPGAWHWVLANPRPLSELAPYSGRQGLFNGPDVDELYRPHDGRTRRVDLREELADVVITRPSKWGNPWRVVGPSWVVEANGYYWRLQAGSRIKFYQFGKHRSPEAAMAECLDRYKTHVRDSTELMNAIKAGELHGKRLGCFCEAGSPCHGDVLVRLDREVNGE